MAQELTGIVFNPFQELSQFPNAEGSTSIPDSLSKFDPTGKLLSPLALDRTTFPCRKKKTSQNPAKQLNAFEDLAHTVEKRSVLAYPVDSPVFTAPPWEKTLVNLDYLLAWC
ncbi:hypothetical protein DSO57_1036270 [Entomophthora muscae]|uniref:Uncharacterized protein n=1 Tax=Entomophthora muscae TaxID=34485 RepID=A0ACC2TLR1_9FUNG|nr:hypothetical protein DSO57_1036270 [Entomophthora muscae]